MNQLPKLPPEIASTFERDERLNPYALYTLFNQQVPSKLSYFKVDGNKIIESLVCKLNLQENRIIRMEAVNGDKSERGFSRILLMPENNTFIYVLLEDIRCARVDILYNHASDKALIATVEDLNRNNFLSCRRTKTNLFLVANNGSNGLYLKKCNIKKMKIKLEEHYNDDFMPIHQLILKRLKKKDCKGLLLLHGEPGTGKTSYLRYLITCLKKKIIYLPPDITPQITNPSFLEFLYDHKNCVLIIEDAEQVIMKRSQGIGSSVSNLLNLSDGLLSDILHIQIICTFNSHLLDIDQALLHKGRLIAKYEFKPLALEKARHLSVKLGYSSVINKPMTLTEVYNQNEASFAQPVRSTIGFLN